MTHRIRFKRSSRNTLSNAVAVIANITETENWKVSSKEVSETILRESDHVIDNNNDENKENVEVNKESSDNRLLETIERKNEKIDLSDLVSELHFTDTDAEEDLSVGSEDLNISNSKDLRQTFTSKLVDDFSKVKELNVDILAETYDDSNNATTDLYVNYVSRSEFERLRYLYDQNIVDLEALASNYTIILQNKEELDQRLLNLQQVMNVQKSFSEDHVASLTKQLLDAKAQVLATEKTNLLLEENVKKLSSQISVAFESKLDSIKDSISMFADDESYNLLSNLVGKTELHTGSMELMMNVLKSILTHLMEKDKIQQNKSVMMNQSTITDNSSIANVGTQTNNALNKLDFNSSINSVDTMDNFSMTENLKLDSQDVSTCTIPVSHSHTSSMTEQIKAVTVDFSGITDSNCIHFNDSYTEMDQKNSIDVETATLQILTSDNFTSAPFVTSQDASTTTSAVDSDILLAGSVSSIDSETNTVVVKQSDNFTETDIYFTLTDDVATNTLPYIHEDVFYDIAEPKLSFVSETKHVLFSVSHINKLLLDLFAQEIHSERACSILKEMKESLNSLSIFLNSVGSNSSESENDKLFLTLSSSIKAYLAPLLQKIDAYLQSLPIKDGVADLSIVLLTNIFSLRGLFTTLPLALEAMLL